jgi:phosphoenolpyruvate synthase/pyruvate phosphate dikinase
MGELSGTFNDSPEAKIAGDQDQAVAPPEGKVETHVKDCFADAVNKRDNLPVFKVGHDEFNQNMSYGRQRIRFKSGSDAQKFMRGSKYKQSFWIQHADTKFMRKIK